MNKTLITPKECESIYCIYCGTKHSETAKFCPKCGSPIENNESAREPEGYPEAKFNNHEAKDKRKRKFYILTIISMVFLSIALGWIVSQDEQTRLKFFQKEVVNSEIPIETTIGYRWVNTSPDGSFIWAPKPQEGETVEWIGRRIEDPQEKGVFYVHGKGLAIWRIKNKVIKTDDGEYYMGKRNGIITRHLPGGWIDTARWENGLKSDSQKPKTSDELKVLLQHAKTYVQKRDDGKELTPRIFRLPVKFFRTENANYFVEWELTERSTDDLFLNFYSSTRRHLLRSVINKPEWRKYYGTGQFYSGQIREETGEDLIIHFYDVRYFEIMIIFGEKANKIEKLFEIESGDLAEPGLTCVSYLGSIKKIGTNRLEIDYRLFEKYEGANTKYHYRTAEIIWEPREGAYKLLK